MVLPGTRFQCWAAHGPGELRGQGSTQPIWKLIAASKKGGPVESEALILEEKSES